MVDFEKEFISCLLSKPSLISRVGIRIKGDFFSNERYKNIFVCMCSSYCEDVRSVAEKTGISFAELISLSNISSPDVWIDQYAWGIVESYKKRELEKLKTSNDLSTLPERIAEIRAIEYFTKKDADPYADYLEFAEAVYADKPLPGIVKTGFFSLDSIIGGFKNAELIIIGGRPGSGKSSLALNIIYNIAKINKVLFFSLEMSKQEIIDRFVKSELKISSYRNCNFDEVINFTESLKKSNIKVYDDVYTIEDISLISHKEKADIIFIDHLSILSTIKDYRGNRVQEISYLTRKLKILAKELNIPVVALCQLNRQLETRSLKAPCLADLRDSGTIEQDANMVLFVYRPEYHLMQEEPDKNSREHIKWEENLNEVKGKARLILAKNRRGRSGNIDLRFSGEYYKFYEE